MILVDTSCWIEHLRLGNGRLQALLNRGRVLAHPMVVGELACGHLARRTELLRWLSDLPWARQATHGEVLRLIDRRQLFGRGLGYVDAHLLAATLITPHARLWTQDRRLGILALELGIAA
jgi:predicted nucleic acid-binding protein